MWIYIYHQTSNVELNTVTGYDRYENMYYVISVNEVI